MTEKKKTSVVNTLARQVAQGATMSAGDELMDGVAAAYASAITGRPLKELWTEARQQSVEGLANDWKDNPGTALAGNITGGIALGGTRPVKTVYDWATRGGTLGALLKSGALGAASGAGAGYASGEGDSRGDSALFGAGIGLPLGVLGGVLGKAFQGKNTDVSKAARKVEKQYANAAEKFIAKDLASRPELQQTVKQAERISEVAQKKGIPLTLAEKVAYGDTDPLIAQQAKLGSSGQTGGRLAKLYKDRQGKLQVAYEDVAASLSPADTMDTAVAMVAKDADKAGRAITKELSAKASPMYKAAYERQIPESDLKAFVEGTPGLEDYIQMARSDLSLAPMTRGKPDNSVEVLDAVKRKMAATMQNKFDPARPADTRAVSNMMDKLDEFVYQYAPELKDARGVYTGSADDLAARTRLGPLASVDPSNPQKVVRDLLSGSQQTAKQAAEALGPEGSKSAAAAIVRDALETNRGNPEAIVRKLAPNDRTSEQLAAYAGDAAGQIDDVNELARKLLMGNRVIKGSATDDKATAGKELAKAAAEGVMGGPRAAFRSFVNALGLGNNENPQFYEDLYRLFTTDDGMNLLRQVASQQAGALDEARAIAAPITPAQVVSGVPAKLLPAKGVALAKESAPFVSTTTVPSMLGQATAEPPLRVTVRPPEELQRRRDQIKLELRRLEIMDQLKAMDGVQ